MVFLYTFSGFIIQNERPGLCYFSNPPWFQKSLWTKIHPIEHLKMYKTSPTNTIGLDYIMIYKKPDTRCVTDFLDRNNIWFNKFNIKKIIFEQSVNKLDNRL